MSTEAQNTSRDQLRSFIERIERLEEEKQTIADDIKDVKSEAKAMGFDVPTINKIIKLRKKDADERAEEAILAAYMAALGMISEEARKENLALADAVATKFGNGPKESPRKAAEAASERISDQSLANGPCDAVAERPALVGSETILAEAAVLGQPEMIAALTGQHSGANVSGPEMAGVTAGETALNSPDTANDMYRTGRTTAEPNNAMVAENARKAVPETEDGSVSHAGAGESPAAIFNSKPYVLRPFCQKPGADDCGGVGSRHCYACEKSKREAEEAA